MFEILVQNFSGLIRRSNPSTSTTGRSNLVYRNSLARSETADGSAPPSRSGGQVSRNPASECGIYPLLHFSPLPYTGSSPVAALPFSPGVARLPSHRVMTCRLSDLARGEAARFEPRNDRHRRPVEDEEKDRTEAADKRERDGDPEEVSASETARGRRTS